MGLAGSRRRRRNTVAPRDHFVHDGATVLSTGVRAEPTICRVAHPSRCQTVRRRRAGARRVGTSRAGGIPAAPPGVHEPMVSQSLSPLSLSPVRGPVRPRSRVRSGSRGRTRGVAGRTRRRHVMPYVTRADAARADRAPRPRPRAAGELAPCARVSRSPSIPKPFLGVVVRAPLDRSEIVQLA